MPADYVNKLARMFQDIKVSEDLNQEFKEAHRNNNEGLAGQSEHYVSHLFIFKLCFVFGWSVHWRFIQILLLLFQINERF